jgi:hypothetical protein
MSMLKHATSIVESYLQNNSINPDDLPEFMSQIHQTLINMKRTEFAELNEIEKQIQLQIQDERDARQVTIEKHQAIIGAYREQLNEINKADFELRSDYREAIQMLKDQIDEAKEVKAEALVVHDETSAWLRDQLIDARSQINFTEKSK